MRKSTAEYLAEKHAQKINELIRENRIADLVEFIGDLVVENATNHEAANHPVVGGFRMPD